MPEKGRPSVRPPNSTLFLLPPSIDRFDRPREMDVLEMALQCEQRARERGSEYEWVSELSPPPRRSLGAHFHILHAYLVRGHRSVSRDKQLF